jgi:hypothetical protein
MSVASSSSRTASLWGSGGTPSSLRDVRRLQPEAEVAPMTEEDMATKESQVGLWLTCNRPQTPWLLLACDVVPNWNCGCDTCGVVVVCVGVVVCGVCCVCVCGGGGVYTMSRGS